MKTTATIVAIFLEVAKSANCLAEWPHSYSANLDAVWAHGRNSERRGHPALELLALLPLASGIFIL